MEIYICDLEISSKIIEELEEYTKINKVEKNNIYKNESEKTFTNEYFFSEDLLHIVSYSDEKLKIEFYETKPPHLRYILCDQLEMILNKLKVLKSLELSKLNKSSWFCVLWTPLKCSKPQNYNTSFLAYYQFNQSEVETFYRDYNNYSEIPIIGILPIKFDENIWLNKSF